MSFSWRRHILGCIRYILVVVLAVLVSAASPSEARDGFSFRVETEDDGLRATLRAASLTAAAAKRAKADAGDIVAAALADYPGLVGALYAEGYYGGRVSIRINGRETADLPLLALPNLIETIDIAVDPGPRFSFGVAEINPLAPGAVPDPALATGRPARSEAIRTAVGSAVDAWRVAGHAKAAPAGQRIIADHRTRRLAARVQIDPGPKVRFGDLVLTTPSAVREARLRRIAGLPRGAVFSPDTLDKVATRLRRTGAFASVALDESAPLGSGDSLDIGLAVADAKPRRLGFGAEVASLDGLRLSGYWMHRNLLGGAERLRLDGAVSNITPSGNGIDYELAARLEIPALFGPDTKGFVFGALESLEEPDYSSDLASFGIGVGRVFSDRFEAELGLGYTYSETRDGLGRRSFDMITLPLTATWDLRDDPLDTTRGIYVGAASTPFLGLGGTASGMRALVDGRGYHDFGSDGDLVLAGRLQLATLQGAALRRAHPDFLFYSGGGGTVRGQPYQSLDVAIGGTRLGGRSLVAASAELRARVTQTIGAVAFVDAGYVGPESVYDGSGRWHYGAGLGLRYRTGIGPIRVDLATPLGGNRRRVELYLGIGQAF